MADILSKQYERICSVPREDINSGEFKRKLLDISDLRVEDPVMENVSFSYEVTKKVIAGLNNSAAVGPDGLSVHIFKYGVDIVIEVVNDIATVSVEKGEVPDSLKMGWITPIWKGEDSSNPINY